MKRFLLSTLIALLAFSMYATPITIKPGLTLEHINGKYYIHFEMPNYEEVIDTLTVNTNTSLPLNQFTHAIGDYYFARIRPIEYDYFDYLSEDGRPMLPFYTLYLLLPPNGTNFEVVGEPIIETDTITLAYNYTPSQAENYYFGDFSFDNDYYGQYNDTWYWDDYSIDTIQYRFMKGFIFSIFPCHYEPISKELVIVTEATFEISFDGSYLNNTYLSTLLSEDRSIYYYFDNFVGFPAPAPQFEDQYLIITADQWASETALEDFVDHKQSLGYHVTLTPLTDIGGYSRDAIHDYIKTEFEAYNTKYVLLVGDVEDLPFYDGEEADHTDPPSDVYYSCLSKDNVADQWKDFSPSVFLGRWPVKTSQQLRHIVDKSIASDLYLGEHNPSEIDIFAGDGDHKDYNYRICKYIYDNIVEASNDYTGDLIDGREMNYSYAFSTIENYLEDSETPMWMFVYCGHGDTANICGPYWLYAWAIDHIITSKLDFQSFGFGFSCLLGNIYKNDNFARSWVTSTEGGVSFLGSTTTSYAEMDKVYSRILFNQLKSKPYITIGEFVGNGRAKFYNSNKVVWRRRQAKKYVLYGDPSLYLFGIHLHYNEPFYISKQTIRPDNLEGCNITSVDIYSITGQLLRTGSTNQTDFKGLPAGTYIVIFNSDNNQIIQKLMLQ